jgi:transcriptional regulator with XRE-family HTH domain
MVVRKLEMTLKELRESKFLTQQEVAYKLGVAPTTVSNWERGLQEPRFSLLRGLAELYGITPQEILEAYNRTKQQ